MTLPGYDPDDLDRVLRNRLEDPELQALLTDAEREAYESGDDLLEALNEETIERLVTRD